MNRQSNTDFLFDGLAALVGIFLATALIYWGAAVVLDDPAIGVVVPMPGVDDATNLRYWLALGMAICGAVLVFRSRKNIHLTPQMAAGKPKPGKSTEPSNRPFAGPRWLWILPLIWFGWQVLAAGQSVEQNLTTAAMKHFFTCIACYFLGWVLFRRQRARMVIFCLVVAGFLYAIWTGFAQKYGELEATREFYQKAYRGELDPEVQRAFNTPEFRQIFEAPDFQKRIQSDRVYGTVMYPNTFAGAILLLLPVSLALLRFLCRNASFVVRATLVGSLAYIGGACLVWSGSKAGWLIAMALIGLSAFHWLRRWQAEPAAATPHRSARPATKQGEPIRQPAMNKRAVIGISVGLLAIGLAGFLFKYSDYFRRGAPSVGARFSYWNVALQIAIARPVFGTGPGTFSIPHRQLKAPEAEMARLTHNDYLEQASDSGWVGLISYTAWIFGALIFVYRRGFPNELTFCLWLGCVGFALQSFVEFGLYVPALAWPAMVFLGGLVGNREAS